MNLSVSTGLPMSNGKKLSINPPEPATLATPELPGWKILVREPGTFEIVGKGSVAVRHSTADVSSGTAMQPPPMMTSPSAPNLSISKRSSSPVRAVVPQPSFRSKANSNPTVSVSVSVSVSASQVSLSPGWKILQKDEASPSPIKTRPSSATMRASSAPASPMGAAQTPWKIVATPPVTPDSLDKSVESGGKGSMLLFNPFTIPEETVVQARASSVSIESSEDTSSTSSRIDPSSRGSILSPQSPSSKTTTLRIPSLSPGRVSRSSSSPSFPSTPKSGGLRALFSKTPSSPKSPKASVSSLTASSTSSSSSSSSSSTMSPPPPTPRTFNSFSSLPVHLTIDEKRFLVSIRRARLWTSLRDIIKHWAPEGVLRILFDYIAPQVLLAVVGGYGGFRGYRRTCDVYHPNSRTWESKILPKMPMKTSKAIGCCVQDKLFVVGTSPPNLTTAFVLDLNESSMSWRTLPSLVHSRRDVSICVYLDEVYVFGGATSEEGSRFCEVYSFTSNSWRLVKSRMNTSDGAACVIGDTIYLLGGSDPRNPIPGPGVRYSQSFQPSTGKWADISPMITKRKGLAACTFNNQLYVFGGYDLQSFRALKSCECYDPLTNSWTSLPDMPEPRIGSVACVIGDAIYLSGGRAESLCALATCLVFDVEAKVWAFMPPMSRSRCAHGACLIEF